MLKTIRLTILAAVAMFVSMNSAAQNSEMFRYRLAAPDSLSSAMVRVTEHGSASDVMRRYNSENVKEKSVPGYRVRIFFANNQNARQDAMDVRSRFREQFPEIPTYLFYEIPSFIVTVGNCMNIDEALILLARVSRSYPSAFLWMGNIPVTEFLKDGDITDSVVESAESRQDTIEIN